jgi:hypothetical protein
VGTVRSGKDIFGMGARLYTKDGPVHVVGKKVYSDYVEYLTVPWGSPNPPKQLTRWGRFKRFFLRKVF